MTRDEIKGELTALREAMTAGFARADGGVTALREAVTAGFARADRYFELQQVQFIEFRDEVVGRLDELTARVDRLEHEVQSLRSAFHTFRGWVTREFAEVRGELRELRRVGAAQSAEIQQLSARVDRLERRWNGAGGTQSGSTS
jgi:outer membrane murein-binding lipoprotein Lpp